ncbi:hypothetical protein QE152_g1618 [Popillia japonica]|uniref:Uncharacterized protein n=1 Tax=Popillia japonica TaxID=7064 RepID=A0AAW1N693_POPJA
MTTLQHAKLWQGETCSCRKQRPPKIGEIPRHTAVDVDVKPKETPTPTPNVSYRQQTHHPQYNRSSIGSNGKDGDNDADPTPSVILENISSNVVPLLETLSISESAVPPAEASNSSTSSSPRSVGLSPKFQHVAGGGGAGGYRFFQSKSVASEMSSSASSNCSSPGGKGTTHPYSSSPYSSPTNSPRTNRKRQPLRESRRVSIEKSGCNRKRHEGV